MDWREGDKVRIKKEIWCKETFHVKHNDKLRQEKERQTDLGAFT